MKSYWIYFQMIDHYLDDAGYNMPIECTIVDAENSADAIRLFCKTMVGERFQIVKTED